MPRKDDLLIRLTKIAEEVEREKPDFAATVRREDGKLTLTFGKPR